MPECVTCLNKKRCVNWCGCLNYLTTGHINMVDGVVCFHERLAIEIADRTAGILYREKNEHFLKSFYSTNRETFTVFKNI